MGQFQTSSHYQVEAPNGHSSQGYCTIFTLTGLGLILQTDSALSKSLLLYPGLGYNSPEGAPLPTSHYTNISGHIPAHTTPPVYKLCQKDKLYNQTLVLHNEQWN